MARIDVLPSIDIIKGLKGILDFYLWRGLPCVRAWPTWRPTRQTDASKAAALLFGAIIRAYSLLAELALEFFRLDAADQTRTARDIFVSAVLGHLHEASMSDFLTLLTAIRDSTLILEALVNALHSIDTDEIVTRVEHSVIPDGAATAAAQATQLAALVKIDDLQDALESKALDRLLVRGMDQLWSYQALYQRRVIENTAVAPDDELVTPVVGAGIVRIITHVHAWDEDNVCTNIRINANRTTQWISLRCRNTPPIEEGVDWQGYIALEPDWYIHAVFHGVTGGDNIRLTVTGFDMTKET